MEIKLNKAELERLQREANKHVQDIVRKANKDLQGKPASTVEAELNRRLKAGGVEPNKDTVRGIATDISNGEVTG